MDTSGGGDNTSRTEAQADSEDLVVSTAHPAALHHESDNNVGAAVLRRANELGVSLDAPAVEDPTVVQDVTRETGIDPTFLAALPEDVRREVIGAHFDRLISTSSLRGSDGVMANPNLSTELNISSASSAMNEALTGNSVSLGRDFLHALPPDIRTEILEAEVRILSVHNNQVPSNADASGGGNASAVVIDRGDGSAQAPATGTNRTSEVASPVADANAVFFSSLPDDLRREILATSDDSFISSLPPALAEEARHLQGQRNAGMRGSLLGIAASLGNGTASGTTELGLPALVGSAPNRVHRRLGSTDFGALYGIMDNADDLSALLRGRPQGRNHGDESGGNGNDRHRDPSSVTTVYRLRARSSGLTGSFRSALAMNGGRGGGYGRRTAGLLGASNVTDAYDPMLADYGRPGSSSAQFRTSTSGMTDRNMYNHWLTSLEQHQRYPFPLAIQPDSERAPRIGDLVTRIFNGDSAGLRVNAGSGHVNGIEHAHRSPGRRAPAISGSNVKRHGEAGDDAPTQRVKEFMSEEAVVCMLSLLFQPGSFSRASSSGRSNSFSMISVNRVLLFVSENERLCRFVLVVLMELVEVLLGIPQEEMVEGALPFLLHEKIRLSTAAGLNAHVVSERAVVAQRALDLIHHLIMYNESAVRQLFSEDISSEKGDRMASNTMFVRLLRLLEPRFSGGGPSASGFWSSLDTLISIISHASSCPALTISPEKVQKSTQSDAGPAEATSSKASSGGRVTSQDGNAPPQFSIAVPMLNAQEVRNLVSVLGWTACSEKTLHRVEKVLKRLCCICDGDPPNLNPNGVVAARVLKRELCALADRIGIEYDRFRTRFCNASGSSSSGSEDANTFAVRHELIRGFASDAHEHEVQFLRFAKTFASLDEHAAFAKLVAAHDDDDNDAKDDFLLDSLWEKLGQVLEILESSGIDPYKSLASFDVSDGEGDGEGDDNRDKKGKKSDAVPALSRVSPVMEAFFVMQEHRLRRSSFDNAPDSGSGTLLNPVEGQDEKAQRKSADDSKFDAFVDTHRAAINALLRLRPGLLEGSMKCVLEHPQHLDFENKRAYFRSQIRRQRASAPPVSSLRIHVRREQVFEDSYHQLRLKSAAEMKGHLHVEFVGEEGIDVGGVTREWYAILARRIFDPNHALFVRSAAKTATYQPNTLSYVNEDHLAFFRFVGRIFAKAIYDGALLDAYFTRSFYKHILGVKPSLHDLEPVDPDYYKSMVWILENDITDVFGEGDLTMSAEYDEFGANRVVDLIPNGRHVAVTNENKRAYVQHVTDLRLTKAIEKQIEHFLAGFYDIVPREQIALFNECELELLMSGTPEIDVADLKANVEYSAGYSASRAQIVWFWRSVALMDKDDLARLIMFVTGTSKVPLEGFAALPGMNGGVQKFQIHRVAGDSDRLPSAHTCFNQLDLPEYSSFEKLHDRLLIAIREGAEGFGYA
ncbi:E3 ubiquitin-protein ligase UPL2 [Porphyridium purpureum]|uniref:HECT-type E3 ubiquitin transferase n=1 Tax=Porphyridium purpureum TaxID=35688 RepID=A0A5J4YU58_PORPP|nr:E3 ubiquitin-protein ligase UPL2 [Porphyridium purpureum]|eukprot:POR7259..scf227_4